MCFKPLTRDDSRRAAAKAAEDKYTKKYINNTRGFNFCLIHFRSAATAAPHSATVKTQMSESDFLPVAEILLVVFKSVKK